MKKYTLSEAETKKWCGHTLHKVIYTDEWLKEQEFDKKYIAGGWIESEDNLSQDGGAVVYGNAWAYGDAQVYGDARVCGDARVAQNSTTSMNIRTSEQWIEYQYRKAELQKKFDAEEIE